MLLKQTLSILFLILTTCLFAQRASSDFAPVGSTWHYRGFSFSGQNPLITLKSEKDTMIQTKSCRKVAVYLNDDLIPATYYIFHEANRQVFFFENDSFKILYDFNLEIGDTMYNYQPANRTFVDFTACPGTDQMNVLGKSVVDSVSYLVLNGDSLKTLHFGFSGTPYFFSDVTERIGSSNGLFGRFEMICPTSDEGYVRCYEDDRYFINFTGEDCDLVSNTDDLVTVNFKLYPNPAMEKIFIESDIPVRQLQVFNMMGQLVDEPTSFTEIPITGWGRGVYFFDVRFKNGEQIIEKVIGLSK